MTKSAKSPYPLLRACYAADKDAIRMLLDEGADPNLAEPARLLTPIHALALWLENQSGKEDVERASVCANALIDAGAKFNYANAEGVRASDAFFGAAKAALAK